MPEALDTIFPTDRAIVRVDPDDPDWSNDHEQITRTILFFFFFETVLDVNLELAISYILVGANSRSFTARSRDTSGFAAYFFYTPAT